MTRKTFRSKYLLAGETFHISDFIESGIFFTLIIENHGDPAVNSAMQLQQDMSITPASVILIQPGTKYEVHAGPDSYFEYNNLFLEATDDSFGIVTLVIDPTLGESGIPELPEFPN